MDRDQQETERAIREMDAEKERNRQEAERHSQALTEEMDATYRRNQERDLQSQRAEWEQEIARAQEKLNEPLNTPDQIQTYQKEIADTQKRIADFDEQQARR